MARVNERAKQKYFERIKEYRKITQRLLENEKKVLSLIKSDEKGASYKRIKLANENLDIISYYLIINKLSQALLGVKNENSLNDARKACYKALIYLEEVFTAYIDAPYSDYEDKLKEVAAYPEKDRFLLIRKLGFAINSIESGFGSNSKWKWSFVELEGRMATISKNCLDMKHFIAGLDPRVEGYRDRLFHMELTTGLLQKSAEGYRKKYELSTRRMDDYKKALDYLGALRRLYILSNKPIEAEAAKKKRDVWLVKLNQDMKREEQDARAARLGVKKG
ncbi:MAG: hypothetical protein JXA95_01365 [Spirochaetales bacterium]|nr:hypothetical protein [Spirochaetales bacterium]